MKENISKQNKWKVMEVIPSSNIQISKKCDYLYIDSLQDHNYSMLHFWYEKKKGIMRIN